MSQQIFVNLPIKDLNKSVEFFTKLGYTFNAQFTNENATCMIISENIFAMLLVEPYFKSFTGREICDMTKCNEVLLALSVESKDKVNEMLDKVIAAGGKEFTEAKDHGFMYTRNFQDLDGHVWEIFWMDAAAVK